ncbi:hypothetical protein Syun_000547 [Stephania yunnanensis]|uniref:Membrane protein insertion efficiency factor n=1 Tax=Stephania yunnanensis TaxID=152371 RepID=A0AAP0LDV9_9MAGN
MEGNPPPGALKGRMSFQSFNPSIDKLNEEATNLHRQPVSIPSPPDWTSVAFARSKKLGFSGSNSLSKWRRNGTRLPLVSHRRRSLSTAYHRLENDPIEKSEQEDEVKSVGVEAALTMLRFYKREISPLLPNSCRYVPTCSEYSMEAYKRYGVVKGTVLTAWRLCRCNPFGGSGFDPPRWFDEERPPEQ